MSNQFNDFDDYANSVISYLEYMGCQDFIRLVDQEKLAWKMASTIFKLMDVASPRMTALVIFGCVMHSLMFELESLDKI